MRESEKKVGRADDKLPGTRSDAEGETQEPEKVLSDADDNGPADGGSADWGSEGGGGASYYGGERDRKDRA